MADIYIKVRSRSLSKRGKFRGSYCWPPKTSFIIPWCPLLHKNNDDSLKSVPCMQLHLLNKCRARSMISEIYQTYKDNPHLQVLFIVADKSEFQPLSSEHLLTKLSFQIVIVPRNFEEEIMNLVQNANDVEATVTVYVMNSSEIGQALLPKESENQRVLLKAIQCIIQDKIVVSTTKGIPHHSDICPPDKRLLSFILEILNAQQMEGYIDLKVSTSSMENIIQFLTQPIYFDCLFPMDFIFFIDFAYLIYQNESAFERKISHVFMMKLLDKLLQVPTATVLQQLKYFIDCGDFQAEMHGLQGKIHVFEYTAKAFLKHCEVYSKIRMHPELLHVSLLLTSVAVKLYNKSGKSTEKIWSKQFSEYYKSGFSQDDITCLKKGLVTMKTLLGSDHHLMANWKDFYTVFLRKIHTFEIMRKFIQLSVKHLIKAENDVAFRDDFLQPLTDACLAASSKGRIATQFSNNVDIVIKEGMNFLTFLSLLIMEQQWDQVIYCPMFRKWLKVIFNLIDLSDERSYKQLITQISEVDAPSWSEYERCFYKELENLLMNKCQVLPVVTFTSIVSITSSEYFDKGQIIVEYLGRSKVPKLLSIEEPLCLLITLAINHVSESKQFITYLRTIMECYTKSNQPLNFYIDFMSLEGHPVKKFEADLMNLFGRFTSSIALINQLDKDFVTFFHSIPLTINSLNWSIVKEILENSLPHLKIEKRVVVETVSSAFDKGNMKEEHFASTKIRAALYVLNSLLPTDKLNDFNCYKDYSLHLSVLSKSFFIMWNTFTASEKGKKALDDFVIYTKDISEIQNTIDRILLLKSLVLKTISFLDEKKVTYSNLDAISVGYEAFKSLSDCISSVFQDTKADSTDINKDLLNKFSLSYDSFVSEINGLLVRNSTNLPDLARKSVKSVLSEYGILFPEELQTELDSTLLISSRILESNKAEKIDTVTYRAKEACTLATLETLACHLKNFLSPLHDSVDVLVFLSLHKSQILKKCIEHFKMKFEETDSPGVRMDKLNNAVQKAKTFVELLVEDPENLLSLNAVTDVFLPEDLNVLDLSNENIELSQFYKLKCGELLHVNISESLTTFLELYYVCNCSKSLKAVCSGFGLNNCLEDPVMIRLLNISIMVAEGNQIILKDAKSEVDFIKNSFGITEETLIDHPLFILFLHLKNGCPLYDFASERGYGTVVGMDTFMQEHHLVTTNLLFEEFYEDVLAKLIAAMELIFPFFDRASTLVELWTNITKIGNVKAATSQMLTVNENIEAVRDWFSQANGEAQENNEKILQAILRSGYYVFDFCEGRQVKLTLQFYMYLSNSLQNTQQHQPRTLSLDDIEALSQDLNFMNYNSNTEWGMKRFNTYKGLALKLHACYSDLQYNGHPDYKNPQPKKFSLFQNEGNVSWTELESEVRKCAGKKKKFCDLMVEYREKFPLLSFVNTHKLKVIYDSVIHLIDVDNLLRDVGVFFKLDLNCYSVLYKCIQDLHNEIESNEERKSFHPAQLLGGFLEDLISLPSVQPHLSEFVKPIEDRSILTQKRLDPVTFTLISALSCTHLDLMRLIYWTFDESFPRFHQLLRCSAKTKREDIELFFERILQSESIDKYLVLGLNLISNDLQQVFLEKCSSLKSAIMSMCKSARSIFIYLVEYSPSLFQHVPWILQTDITKIQNLPEVDDIISKVQESNGEKTFEKFEVVYGKPGSGKTHYIRNCIKEQNTGKDTAKCIKTLSINETFNKTKFVKRFRNDSLNSIDVIIYLNINLVWPQSGDYQALFDELVEEINWFFFDYFVLRYVEVIDDYGSTCTSPQCLSLILPTGISTSVYVEAPFWDIPKSERKDSIQTEALSDHYSKKSLSNSFSTYSEASLNDDQLSLSKLKFREIFPVFALLGEEVHPPSSYDVSSSGAQLVCKYLKGHNENNLDHLMKNYKKIVKIDNIIDNVEPEECRRLINEHLPETAADNQMMKTVYLKYMERRCRFMEESVFFQQNTGLPYPVTDDNGKKVGQCNTAKWRSNVFDIMLQEVKHFCEPTISWSSGCHRQLIYDVGNGGGTFKLLCAHPEEMSEKDLQQLNTIGITVPHEQKRLSTEILHDYLSFALNVKKDEKGEIGLIKERKYVLTRDFVHKMLNIHERKECGIPVVIEGETGVGKTFLLELLSSLWNHSWSEQLTLQRSRIESFFTDKILKLQKKEDIEEHVTKVLAETLLLFKCDEKGKVFDVDVKVAVNTFCKLLRLNDPDKPNLTLCAVLKNLFHVNMYDPVLASLELPPELSRNECEFSELLTLSHKDGDEDIMARVVCGIFYGRLRGTFYKISIHSAMTAHEIEAFFREVQIHASSLNSYYENFIRKKPEYRTLYQKPILTVFLDEINTSCCPGFIKEIIIDGTIDGRSISTSGNIFIVAACNPHRANSLAAVTKMTPKERKSWFNPTYYVQNLPPSLKLIMWNYGQLQEADEKEYIKGKFCLEYQGMGQNECNFLAEQIAEAQNLIRLFACKNLKLEGVSEADAKLYAQSTVSQRDIKRVLQLYSWLKKWFSSDNKYKRESGFRISVRAVFISLALVYYFRLSDEVIKLHNRINLENGEEGRFRKHFREKLHKIRAIGECGIPVTFEEALVDELAWVSKNVILPKGIAPTEALMENIYAIIVCTMTKIPLIIVGPPGSSKTLSFKIVASNFLGTKSNKNLKKSDLFKSLNPHFYQCSRKSTSHEIEVVFKRAISCQKTFDEGSVNSLSVVLMDEAGIPEYSHESLKILHSFLDAPEVSFVGLTNTVLDAAKTNRAISVFRNEASHDDLLQLAKYSFCHGQPDESINDKIDIIEGFIKIYEKMMCHSAFNSFFGLRDFIHFFTYLSVDQEVISPQSVVMALEQNFSGTKHFDEILEAFLQIIGSKPNLLQQRSLVDVLHTSFIRKPQDLLSENKTRYKLLIDSSEDQSLVRQLFAFDILKRNETKILSCSKLPGDNDAQKLYTASAIRHSVTQGHTIMIYHAEEIQEYFYDLFNQHFTCIKSTINEGEKFFYSNVAIGPVIKPTRVNPYFNCAMIISQSEVPHTERPFLNRFEKFLLSHEVLLKESLSKQCQTIKILFEKVRKNVINFVEMCGKSSFYGLTNQTIDSLMLSIVSLNDGLDEKNSSSDHANSIEEVTTSHSSEKCQCYTDMGIFIRHLVECFSEMYRIILPMESCEEFSELIKHLNCDGDETAKTFFGSSCKENLAAFVRKDVESWKNAVIDVTETRIVHSLTFHMLSKVMTIHLTKQLLYLMTTEAFVIHSREINHYYKLCYLTYQHHFSLPDIIHCQSNNSKEVRKFLCYTRTSPVLLELIPMQFSVSGTEKKQIMLCQFFKMNSDSLYTYTITTSTSQEKLNSSLKEFFSSSCTVMLLLADMNKLSKDTINHSRILIEEAEQSLKSLTVPKSVFLILHFPSNMFYSHCYPSIFLRGWRHIYMDMIGQNKTLASTDVEEWLKICLLHQNTDETLEPIEIVSFVPDSTLNLWIKEWLPMISNSIPVHCMTDFPGEREIKECWNDLLFEVKVDGVIKKRFNTYWQQSTMYELSLQAANYAITYQSTCTLSSTIGTTIQSSFKNFILFFLSVINHNMAMQTVLSHKEVCIKPFLQILSVLNLPKSLEEIRLELAVIKHQIISSSDRKNLVPQFPFSPVIFELVDALMNKALSSITKPLELVTDEDELESNLPSIIAKEEHELAVKRIAQLFQEEDGIIKVVIELLEEQDLWCAYFNDAITKQLDRTVGNFSKVCLKQHLAHIESGNIPMKLAQLHYHLRVSWLDADSLSLLRILDDCATHTTSHFNIPKDVNLTEESVVIQYIIELLYASVINTCSAASQNSVSKIQELGSLYYKMMNLLKVESVSKFSCQIKNKWIILCLSFHVNHLITLVEERTFITSAEGFVRKLVNIFASTIDSGNIINLTALADAAVSVAFRQGNLIDVLNDATYQPSTEFYSTVEIIFDHYLTFYSDKITEDTAACIFAIIGLVINKCHTSEKMKHVVAKYKYIFSKLLSGSGDSSKSTNGSVRSDNIINPLHLFTDKMRCSLCNAIDQESIQSTPQFYSPPYFKCCQKMVPQSKEHVLCDMYFEITKDKLQRKGHTFMELVSFYLEFNSCSNILSKIVAVEKQAVVHVTIKLLSVTLLKNENERQVLVRAYDDLNKMFKESNTMVMKGKTNVTGNGLVLLMRLFCACKSETILHSMMVTLFQSNLDDYHCLRPVHKILIQEKKSSANELSLLLFLKNEHPKRHAVYTQIHKSIMTIIKSNGIKGVDDLMKMALSCYSSKSSPEKTKWIFNMSIFIALYKEIFSKKMSQRAGAIQRVLHDKISQYVDNILFLPFLMWLNDPNATGSSSGELKDFFLKNEKEKEHVECIMELAAVLFGNEENCCHLWEHLFSLQDIAPSIVPGAMVVGVAGSCYLDAVHTKTFHFTKRESLTWYSLIFTQWMNYGLLCLSLVVKPSVKFSPFHQKPGIILTCLQRLKELWGMIMSELNLSREERKKLVCTGIHNLYKVLLYYRFDESWKNLQKVPREETVEAPKWLSHYECILHDEVFLPAWKLLKSQKKFSMFGSTVGEIMRELSWSVPELNISPAKPLKGFLLSILFSKNLFNKDSSLYILYQFLLRRPALNVGVHLLPNLIDLYNWIHSQASFTVTSDVAKKTSILKVLTLILQQHFPDQKEKRLNQLHTIQEIYKQYIMLDVPEELKLEFNTGLNFYDMVSTDDGKGILYKMIIHIVDSYNRFLEIVHVHRSTSCHFVTYKPKFTIPIKEITRHSCSFGSSVNCHDISDLETIVEKYQSFEIGLNLYDSYESDDSILLNCVPEAYNFESVQAEVVQKFFVHKHYVNKDGFSKDFGFSECSTCEEVPRGLFYTTTYGYKDTIEKLSRYPSLKASLKMEDLLELETLFHSLSYDGLLSVCSGLCLVLKMLLEKASQGETEITTLTIKKFLHEYFNIEMKEIGIELCVAEKIHSGLSVNQYRHLCEMPVSNVMSISELFHEWVKIGFYDFCHLPYCLKVNLVTRQDILQRIETEDEETIRNIMRQLYSMEQLICQKANESCTIELYQVDKERKLDSYFFSLSIMYYVHLQLALRRRLLHLLEVKQKEQHNEKMKQQVEDTIVKSPPSPVLTRMVSIESSSTEVYDDELTTSTDSTCAPTTTKPNESAMTFSYISEDKDLSEAASKLTVDDIGLLLERLGLQDGLKFAQTNLISGDVVYSYLSLPSLEESGLMDLGIHNKIDELKFRIQFKRLLEGKKLDYEFTPEILGNFLTERNSLSRFAKVVQDKNIDGEMLLLANDEVFRELGIPALFQVIIKKELQQKLKDF